MTVGVCIFILAQTLMAILLHIFINFFERSADPKYLLFKLKHESLSVKLLFCRMLIFHGVTILMRVCYHHMQSPTQFDVIVTNSPQKLIQSGMRMHLCFQNVHLKMKQVLVCNSRFTYYRLKLNIHTQAINQDSHIASECGPNTAHFYI